jgi:hypothetical protein
MTPRLSAIAITPDNYETIRAIVRAVGRQDLVSDIELVIVGPPREQLEIVEKDLHPFARVTFVAMAGFCDTPAYRAAGIRAASAEVIVLLEEHCFPAAGWARALLARHEGDWTGVAPLVLNGNPSGSVSWSNFLTEYGGWFNAPSAQPLEHIPGHNSSYKRAPLMEYGDRLEQMIASESAMQLDLGSRGHRFCIDRDARVFHLNPSLLLPSLSLTYWGGRLYASNRSRDWSLARRLFYGTASPLIPLVRFSKIWPVWRGAGRSRPSTVSLLATLSVILVANGAGEMMGYLAGEGAAVRKTSRMEFKRRSYMLRKDRLARPVDEALRLESA